MFLYQFQRRLENRSSRFEPTMLRICESRKKFSVTARKKFSVSARNSVKILRKKFSVFQKRHWNISFLRNSMPVACGKCGIQRDSDTTDANKCAMMGPYCCNCCKVLCRQSTYDQWGCPHCKARLRQMRSAYQV